MHLRALGPEELMDSHSLGPEEPVDFHALRPEDLHQARFFANRNEMLRAFGEMDTVVEIGVAYGHFSRFILDTVKPRRLHLFDLFDIHERDYMTGIMTYEILQGMSHRDFIEKSFAKEIAAGTVHLHEGDSSRELSKMPDGFADCIYIDGHHWYESVLKDATVSAKKLKHDGYLVFNDYVLFFEGIRRRVGVVPVVNNMCGSGEWSVTHFALQAKMLNDITLRRRKYLNGQAAGQTATR
jgi:Methyltransferase domain